MLTFVSFTGFAIYLHFPFYLHLFVYSTALNCLLKHLGQVFWLFLFFYFNRKAFSGKLCPEKNFSLFASLGKLVTCVRKAVN